MALVLHEVIKYLVSFQLRMILKEIVDKLVETLLKGKRNNSLKLIELKML